jgi:hypothetical protein
MPPADCDGITAGGDRTLRDGADVQNTSVTRHICDSSVGASLALCRRVEASVDRGMQLAVERTRLAYERNMMARHAAARMRIL